MLINPVHNLEAGNSSEVTHVSRDDGRTIGEGNASYQKIGPTYLSQSAAGPQLIKLCRCCIIHRNDYDLQRFTFYHRTKQTRRTNDSGKDCGLLVVLPRVESPCDLAAF